MCLCVRIFSKFDLKFGREVDLDKLNNIWLGTFTKFPLSTEILTLENRVKMAVLHTDRLITFEPLDRFEKNLALHPLQTFAYKMAPYRFKSVQRVETR